jgi:hypothetical protein
MPPIATTHPEDHGRRDEQIDGGDRQHVLPAELHQLVIAVARQRPPHPDIEEEQHRDLDEKPDPAEPRRQNGPCQPPRKRSATTADTVTMLMYSAMKNSAKLIELYSVW